MSRGEDSRHDPARKVGKERYFRVYTTNWGLDSQGESWTTTEGFHFKTDPSHLFPENWDQLSNDHKWQHFIDAGIYPKQYPGDAWYPISKDHPDFEKRYDEAFDGNQDSWAEQVIEDTDPDKD